MVVFNEFKRLLDLKIDLTSVFIKYISQIFDKVGKECI